jgi:hypothetical protein
MIEELKGHLASETYSLLECFCTVYQQNTAFAPFLHLLRRAFGIQREDSPQAKLAKLRTAMEHVGLVSEEGIALIAPLVGVPPEAGYTPPDVSPLRQRQLTMETLTNWLLKSAEQSPVLCIVEDLHWADPSSLELLGLVLSGLRTHPLLVLLTFRPEFRSPWPAHEGMHDMALTGLTPEQVTALATHVAHNRTLPTAVLTEVVKRTDGVPLFVEEMTKMLLESGFLKAANGSYELSGPFPARAIPVTVQDSLMARLDRLGSAKTLAQLGATIGRDFRHDVLQAVAEEGEVALERDLGLLLDANMVTRDGLPPEVTYTFRHALIQDAAYESLLKSTRQQYHQRIARVLAEHFPRSPRPNRNSWPSTSPLPASTSRRWVTGTKRVRGRWSARPIWKRSTISAKALNCSLVFPRHRSGFSKNSCCSSVWGCHFSRRQGTRPRRWARSFPGLVRSAFRLAEYRSWLPSSTACGRSIWCGANPRRLERSQASFLPWRRRHRTGICCWRPIRSRALRTFG